MMISLYVLVSILFVVVTAIAGYVSYRDSKPNTETLEKNKEILYKEIFDLTTIAESDHFSNDKKTSNSNLT